MSGRPPAPSLPPPSYTPGIWATDANYPPGVDLWSAQPTKVEPPNNTLGFVPGQGAGAPYVNYLFNQVFSNIASAKAWETSHNSAVQSSLQSMIEFAGQMPALNFLSERFADNTRYYTFAMYNTVDRKWYVGETQEWVMTSETRGLLWPASGIPGIATVGANENPIAGDFDTSGRMVISTNTRYVFAFDGTTWTKPDVGGVAEATTVLAQVVFDPVHNLWCWLGGNGTGQSLIKTSSDRVVWTTRTATGLEATDSRRMAVNKSTGTIVATGRRTSDNAHVFARSTNGGITWSVTALASSIVGGNDRYITHNTGTNRWMMIAGNALTPKCEVWVSEDDGLTWGRNAILSSCFLTQPAGIGSLWVAWMSTAVDGVPQLAYSTLSGASWQHVGFRSAGSFVGTGAGGAGEFIGGGVFYGGGQVLALTDSRLYRGMVFDTGSSGTLT